MADRLSLDSTAAMRAGMSYGKWKALHPHTDGEMPEFSLKLNLIPCKYCGTPFEKKKSNQRFCCVRCSQLASYQRNKEKNRQRERQRRERRKQQQEGK